jgi:hypothetical protein
MKNSWLLHNALFLLSFISILQIILGDDTTDTIWRVITNATPDPARQANVQNILSLKPGLIQVMVGNDGLDLDCILYLNENGIRISKSYYHGAATTIHSGKIGHWCTFLRFLDIVQESGKSGVWIENDVILELKHIEEIMQIIRAKPAKAEVRMSAGDGVVIINNASQMLQVVKNAEITDPVDLFYDFHEMVQVVSQGSLIQKIENVMSGITTTIQYPIDLVNKMIQHRVSPPHQEWLYCSNEI